jgi:hypothetical protein
MRARAIASILQLAQHRKILVHLSKSSTITAGVPKTFTAPKTENHFLKNKIPYCLNTHQELRTFFAYNQQTKILPHK